MASKKINKGRGPVGKKAVIGMKDRDTNWVTAMTIQTGRTRPRCRVSCLGAGGTRWREGVHR